MLRSEQPVSPAPLPCHFPKTLPCTCLLAPCHRPHWLSKALPSSLPLLSFSNSCFCQSVPPSASWKVLFYIAQGQLMVMPLRDAFLVFHVRVASLPHAFLERSSGRLHGYHPPIQTTSSWSPFGHKPRLPRRKEGLTSLLTLTRQPDVGSSGRTT